MAEKPIVIIAGPNGAGKTTFAEQYLPKEAGYRIHLVFLSLPSRDMAVARVASRVMNGGHNIPEATIRRRYESGRSNFNHLYKPLADKWFLYDNSNVAPVIIEEGCNP